MQRTYLHEFEPHFVVCGQGQCKLLTNKTTSALDRREAFAGKPAPTRLA
jgi:hypothetical protein